MVLMLMGSVCAGVLSMPATAQDCMERVSSVEKGSLLIYPKVEIRWDRFGQVIQDTFIDLTNDYPDDVLVQMQFVNGDPPLPADHSGNCVFVDPGPPAIYACQGGPNDGCFCTPDGGLPCWERDHFGDCNSVDVMIELTANEPTYWSAATGLPKGTSPFSILDPGFPPGRPDQDGGCARILRGFILAWAVDEFGEQIGWNHLKGDALIVDYGRQAAWEYNAYAFQVHSVGRGELVLPAEHDPAMLELNGDVYDIPFDKLLLDFYAYDANPPGPFDKPGIQVTVNTDLTLLPLDIDLRQDGEGAVTTKAVFDIWNMNEWKFSGTYRCIRCWDQTWISVYDPPNHFLRMNLQTNKGKARIDGVASTVCPDSVASPMLGVAMKYLVFNGGALGFAKAGMNLVGMGEEEAVIYADVHDRPDEKGANERYLRSLGKGTYDIGR
jgi:hypothetical protein